MLSGVKEGVKTRVCFCVFSFLSDSHLIVEASVVVTVQPKASVNDADKKEERLWPTRHNISLPLNGLNMLFENCEAAVNHHSQITSDRYPPPLPFLVYGIDK